MSSETSAYNSTYLMDLWLETNYQFIETYIHMVRDTSHLVNKVMFPHRRPPARPDSVQVAKLVAFLEERVYAIEDALMTFKEGDLKVAPDQVIEGLVVPECVEGKQYTLDTLSSILQRTEVIGELAGRLERVESKLDILLAALEKPERIRKLSSANLNETPGYVVE